jgi:hypothetical protein
MTYAWRERSLAGRTVLTRSSFFRRILEREARRFR